jgi:flagellar hook-basal body complex protein FliE
MSDPLGLVSASHSSQPAMRAQPGPGVAGATPFKDVLRGAVDEVNRAQSEATMAVEDLQTGRRDDIEGVMLAAQKADNAFKMLQALRNKVMEAYEEVKQMRT